MCHAARAPAVCSVLLAACLSGGSSASAHELERTQVVITVAPDGGFVLDIANDPAWLLLRLESFADGAAPEVSSDAARDRRLAELGAVFVDRVVLFVDGREIRPDSAEYIPPPATGSDTPLARFRLRGQLPRDARVLRWLYGLVADPYPLSIQRADGASHLEWVLGANWSGVIDLAGQFRRPSRVVVMRQYLALGYTHILPKGLDHILFVIGLLLLTTRIKPLVVQVTTFTVAHSMTLALSILGLLSLPARLVEPLIALSIAYVALENLWSAELKPWRLALVFAFGLLHGLGFAGVLAELGLPPGEMVTALVSFNLGVEAGQLTVIALAGAVLIGWRHRAWYRQRVVVPASCAIALVGIYWTVVRVAA